jgi:hypothetical protein
MKAVWLAGRRGNEVVRERTTSLQEVTSTVVLESLRPGTARYAR